jgi:sterol 14-demethylase
MDVSVASTSSWSGLVIKLVWTLATCIVLSVLWNIFSQLVFKNSNEPPIVFHWVPVIGSTIDYGIDPFKFFKKCQAKVGMSKHCYVGTCDVNFPLIVW